MEILDNLINTATYTFLIGTLIYLINTFIDVPKNKEKKLLAVVSILVATFVSLFELTSGFGFYIKSILNMVGLAMIGYTGCKIVQEKHDVTKEIYSKNEIDYRKEK